MEFNNLRPFIEDTTKQINVREYAKLQRISPPTASKLLNSYAKEGLLIKEETMQRHLYRASKTPFFIDVSRLYWKNKLKELIEYFENATISPLIILYGSLSKAENTLSSDVDIAIFTPTKIKPDLKQFEETLKREIRLFAFSKPSEVRNKDLLNNMLNGTILTGRLRVFPDFTP